MSSSLFQKIHSQSAHTFMIIPIPTQHIRKTNNERKRLKRHDVCKFVVVAKKLYKQKKLIYIFKFPERLLMQRIVRTMLQVQMKENM